MRTTSTRTNALKRPAPSSLQKTPVKRQNATVSFIEDPIPIVPDVITDTCATPPMDEIFGEDANIGGDENEDPVYFRWTQRVLTKNEITSLKAMGWGNYLTPSKPEMRLAVLMTKHGKNAGRHFLNIGHPDLEIGFATFLDEIKKKPYWWDSAKLNRSKIVEKSKLTEAERLELTTMRHDIITLQDKIRVLKQELDDLKEPFLD